MVKTKVVVVNRSEGTNGIHTRPASRIKKVAIKYHCDVSLRKIDDNYVCNAKSVLGVLLLIAGTGTVLEVVCDGIDEQVAIKEIVDVFVRGLGEDICPEFLQFYKSELEKMHSSKDHDIVDDNIKIMNAYAEKIIAGDKGKR